MCGRFVATTAPSDLALLFDAVLDDPFAEQFRPNYNVAPTTQVLTLVNEASAERNVLRRAHWGLLPSWSKDRKRAASMINARSETLTEKPSFRNLVARHRCVVPVDGYYEWRTVGVATGRKTPKRPYFIASPDARPLALAGLWTTWKDPERDGQLVRSCAIITTTPNERLAEIHDRMPCVLDGDDIDEWLVDETAPLHLLRTAAPDRLAAHSVSAAVNSVRNNGPDLVVPTETTLF
jgi:putative SOS response-associated peptidase YedK